MNKKSIAGQQSDYWEKKAQQFPEGGHQALGSESLDHKWLRYELVSALFATDHKASILDIGAGVGDFYDYLQSHFPTQGFDYTGVEITEAFCQLGRAKYPNIRLELEDVLSDQSEILPGAYDYVVVSGVFHQPGDTEPARWEVFIRHMLKRAFAISRKGIAFNFLNHYADFQRPGNYHANLYEIQEFVAQELSRFYTAEMAAPLFESTLCVYKQEYIAEIYSSDSFKKYLQTRG